MGHAGDGTARDGTAGEGASPGKGYLWGRGISGEGSSPGVGCPSQDGSGDPEPQLWFHSHTCEPHFPTASLCHGLEAKATGAATPLTRARVRLGDVGRAGRAPAEGHVARPARARPPLRAVSP